MIQAITPRIVRPAGKILCVGTLNHHNTVHMKLVIRKRIDILFSYGGQVEDLKEVLDLVSRGILNPMVINREVSEFPKLLKDLEAGRVLGRVAFLYG